MNTDLNFFIYAILSVILLYIAYQKGRCKGQVEAYDDCLKELEKLKKFVEKEK